MALTCTPIAGQAAMRLVFDFTAEAGTQTSVIVARSVNGGDFTNLAGYGLLCQQGTMYDTTAPLDVPITWQVTANDGTFFQCSGTIDSEGSVWFKDPGRPWANLKVDLCSQPTGMVDADCVEPLETAISLISFGELTWAADMSLYPILNAELPVDVFARRKNTVSSIKFASRTCEAIEDIYRLFTAGGPLFIQAPPEYCWDDQFVQPGDLSMAFISPDQRKPWRMWEFPLTRIDPVFQDSTQGTLCNNWCAIEEEYATFADLTATGLTWGEVEQGEALC